MPRRDDDEKELQTLLRNVAAAVMLALLSLLVIAAVFTPLVTERSADTTLLLGLTASLSGALLALLGVQVVLNRKNGNGRNGGGGG